MQSQNLKVLAVDDDEINLEILLKNLKDYGYQAQGCKDGMEAWKALHDNPEEVDIVLLDKMMPKMGGMEVLYRMQNHEMLKNIPVIIQTGDVGIDSVKEGIAAGAYYYLCKPFDPSLMVALVNAAARDFVKKNNSYKEVKHEKTFSSLINHGKFTVKDSDDAIKLSAALSYSAESPDRINTALLELMINSIEHGNLEIGYEEKSLLLKENRLEQEILRRKNMPEYKDKIVEVQLKNVGDETEITICDEGHGFPWRKFVEFDPLRLTEPNGRGIAMAKLMGMNVEYAEPGNKVICRFKKEVDA